MSWASLSAAAVARLKSQLTLTAETVQIRRRRTGTPVPGAPGQLYIIVHQAGGHTRDTPAVTPVTFSFAVTISVRMPGHGAVPEDRDDESMTKATYGLDAMIANVYTALHGVPGGYAVTEAASTGGWIHPPVMTDEGTPVEDGEWLTQTMTFGQAQRVVVGSGVS